MSYAPRLTDTARQGLSALPFEVQEAVLDWIDELTSETGMLSRPRPSSRSEVFERVIRFNGKLYIVWLVVRFDHRSLEVGVDAIGHATRE